MSKIIGIIIVIVLQIAIILINARRNPGVPGAILFDTFVYDVIICIVVVAYRYCFIQ